jgi:hypothetical protein
MPMPPLSLRAGRIRTRRLSLLTVGHAFTVAALVWGSLAFGAVYPWAFWPLAALAQAAGLAGLFAASPDGTWRDAARPAAFSRGLVLALIAVLAAALVQLIPLPPGVLRAANPNGVELLRQFDPAFAGAAGAHPLSLAPAATRLAVALLVSFSILLEDVDGLQPPPLRGVIQLAQMTQRPLPRPIRRADRFDQRPVGVALPVFVAMMGAQEHGDRWSHARSPATRG